MNTPIEVWEGEGGAHSSVAAKVVRSTRHHRTLWIGVLYVIAIVVILAVVAKLY